MFAAPATTDLQHQIRALAARHAELEAEILVLSARPAPADEDRLRIKRRVAELVGECLGRLRDQLDIRRERMAPSVAFLG